MFMMMMAAAALKCCGCSGWLAAGCNALVRGVNCRNQLAIVAHQALDEKPAHGLSRGCGS
jgi:hypothetical protein